MLQHSAKSLSPPHRLSPSIKSIHALSLLFLTIKGVQYPAVAFAAAVTPGNSPTPIPAETYSQVATPAESAEDLQRICVALCTAGLGGPPCEPYHCSELFSSNIKNSGVGDAESEYDKDPSDPRRHPCGPHHHGQPPHYPPTIASSPSTTTAVPRSIAMPRRMVCGKLCDYDLGMPLCECALHQRYIPMDVALVCHMFCTSYGYQVDSCPVCTDVSGLVEDASYQQQKYNHWAHGSAGSLISAVSSALTPQTSRKQMDWNQWCKERCAVGDGGAACNCDILPLNIPRN